MRVLVIVEEGEVHESGVCMSNALRDGQDQDESMKQWWVFDRGSVRESWGSETGNRKQEMTGRTEENIKTISGMRSLIGC